MKDFAKDETFITDLHITPTTEKRDLAFCPTGYNWWIELNGKAEMNWFTDREHEEKDFLNTECQKMRPMF